MMAAECMQGNGWRLKELLGDVAECNVAQCDDVLVFGLSIDSRRIGPGDLFIACSGHTARGHDYIEDAIKYGASAVLYDSSNSNYRPNELSQVPVIGVEGLSSKVGIIADRFFASPSKELVVTGVTGTNGKTSCSHIIAHVLSKAMSTPAGVMGTLGNGLYGSVEKASHTTPEPIAVHRMLSEMKRRGAKDVVMEVSSHGLAQDRVAGVAIDVAVFTNISRDHLDYHQTMQAYVEAKARLFSMPSVSCVVVNLDDEYCCDMLDASPASARKIGYAVASRNEIKKACAEKVDSVVYGSVVNSSLAGSEVKVESDWGTTTFSTSLLGEFNVSNLLAALAVLLWRGVPFDEAVARLATVRPFAGRMEVIANESAVPTVVIDYAHTPDALEKVLKSIKQYTTAKLWCVFGCGGDRDQGKRAEMGRVAEQYADHVVVTDDNPRTESPQLIVNAIVGGMNVPEDASVIHSREQAIEHAVRSASPQDVILIAGKGHEDYQEINGKRSFFSDHAVALSVLSQEVSQ